MQNFFFILCCQRSGSTLLRLILDSHNKIHCFDEKKSYLLLSDNSLLNNELTNYANKKLIGFKTPVFTEQMNNSILIDYVNNLKIKNTFENSKIIFIYRNVLDVVSSMKNHIQKNGHSWLENWGLNTINSWEKSHPDLIQKFTSDLKYLRKTKNKDIVSGAIYWKVKNFFMFSYENEKKPLLKVKYEDLCQNPKIEIEKIINFLNVDWDNNVLNHEQIFHDEVEKNGLTVGNNDATKKISVSEIGRYINDFTNAEKNEIMEISTKLMKKMNYPILSF